VKLSRGIWTGVSTPELARDKSQGVTAGFMNIYEGDRTVWWRSFRKSTPEEVEEIHGSRIFDECHVAAGAIHQQV